MPVQPSVAGYCEVKPLFPAEIWNSNIHQDKCLFFIQFLFFAIRRPFNTRKFRKWIISNLHIYNNVFNVVLKYRVSSSVPWFQVFLVLFSDSAQFMIQIRQQHDLLTYEHFWKLEIKNWTFGCREDLFSFSLSGFACLTLWFPLSSRTIGFSQTHND